MLYDHELLRKLRIGAFVLSLFLLGYAALTFRDNNMSSTRLIILTIALGVSAVFTYLLKKPNKILFTGYLGSMALGFVLTLFRMRANIALDITLLAIAIGLMIGFWTEARKKSEFAKFQ